MPPSIVSEAPSTARPSRVDDRDANGLHLTGAQFACGLERRDVEAVGGWPWSQAELGGGRALGSRAVDHHHGVAAGRGDDHGRDDKGE